MIWARHVARMAKKRNAYRFLVAQRLLVSQEGLGSMQSVVQGEKRDI
jgi:hypothetical protein